MLTPKETGGGGFKIPFSGIVTAVVSSQLLPIQATSSLWYLDDTTWHHVHVAKDGTTVTVAQDNSVVHSYTGTIGTTYADLIKNVLTQYYGEWNSAWAEVHCADQLVDVDVFVVGSGAKCKPIEVDMPETTVQRLVDTTGAIKTSTGAITWYTNVSKLYDGLYGAYNTYGVFYYAAKDATFVLDFDSNEKELLGCTVRHSKEGGTRPQAMQWASVGTHRYWRLRTVNEMRNVSYMDVTWACEYSDDGTTWTLAKEQYFYDTDSYNVVDEIQWFEPHTYTYGDSGAYLDLSTITPGRKVIDTSTAAKTTTGGISWYSNVGYLYDGLWGSHISYPGRSACWAAPKDSTFVLDFGSGNEKEALGCNVINNARDKGRFKIKEWESVGPHRYWRLRAATAMLSSDNTDITWAYEYSDDGVTWTTITEQYFYDYNQWNVLGEIQWVEVDNVIVNLGFDSSGNANDWDMKGTQLTITPTS